MPRLVDYPHGSLKSALEIAAAVDYLGGSCSIVNCADRLKKKISGAFRSLISASIKHGLITNNKEVLNTTELYRVYKLAYDENEKLETLRKVFFYPPLYQKIYERFKGKELPVAMLHKLLIRELGVEERYGSRTAGYFIDGAKSLKLLENGKLIDDVTVDSTTEVDEIGKDEGFLPDLKLEGDDLSTDVVTLPLVDTNDYFTVMIVGPGMNTKIQLGEEDDLIILDAMINKIKKKLKEGSK
ncbi:hypothetical protein [Daejeonella sp. JGW-45]|uniref:hypothetical protein n=1 Tax=Daejeonella sp. JGW-45 TaxID=3034148 RepID=UPI0023EB421E|nr:hypothetical protein [Daejeonella sp. JGW-45]